MFETLRDLPLRLRDDPEVKALYPKLKHLKPRVRAKISEEWDYFLEDLHERNPKLKDLKPRARARISEEWEVFREDLHNNRPKLKDLHPRVQAKIGEGWDDFVGDLHEHHPKLHQVSKLKSQFATAQNSRESRPKLTDLYGKLKSSPLRSTSSGNSNWTKNASVVSFASSSSSSTARSPVYTRPSAARTHVPDTSERSVRVDPFFAIAETRMSIPRPPTPSILRNMQRTVRPAETVPQFSSFTLAMDPEQPMWNFDNLRDTLPVVDTSTNRRSDPPVNDRIPTMLSVRSETPAWTCVACADELPRDNFGLLLTSSCKHINSACVSCVQQWISTQLTEQSWDNIKCIECEELMHYDDVKRHADAETFQRYDHLAALSVYNNDPDFMWCLNAECGAGQVHEGGNDTPIFHCRMCDRRYCINHKVPWHEGETCQAFDRRMAGEAVIDEGTEMDEATSRLLEAEGIVGQSAEARQRADRTVSVNAGPMASLFRRGGTSNPTNQLRERNDSVIAQSLQDFLEEDENKRQADIKAKRNQERERKIKIEADAAAARALAKTFEDEERKRKEAEREREAYQKRLADEKLGEQTVLATTKKCPRCQWSIQKIDGCEHMTCRRKQCGYEFCWLCLADYESIRRYGNSAHNIGCRDRY